MQTLKIQIQDELEARFKKLFIDLSVNMKDEINGKLDVEDFESEISIKASKKDLIRLHSEISSLREYCNNELPVKIVSDFAESQKENSEIRL